jgi:hypothetical protein
MTNEVLFTINIRKNSTCEFVDIYGPTKQKLDSGRPINKMSHPLSTYVICERKNQLERLNSYPVKHKYFQSQRMDEWEAEIMEIMKISNWKLRVLHEQHLDSMKKMEAAEALVDLSKGERVRRSRTPKKSITPKRSVSAKQITTKQIITTEPRRSQRLKNKQ